MARPQVPQEIRRKKGPKKPAEADDREGRRGR